MNKDKTIEKRAGFTQGPWTSEDCTPGESTGLCYAIKSEHTIVARTTDGWKEAQANARLIASAPELYAQCRMLENLLENLQDEKGAHELCSDYEVESYKQVNEQLAQVRELLAKVDGGDEG